MAPLTRSRLKRHSSVHCRLRSPYVHHLHWWVRLAAWALAGLPLWLLEPRIAPLGPALFETFLVLTGIRAHRRWRRRRRPSGPPGHPRGSIPGLPMASIRTSVAAAAGGSRNDPATRAFVGSRPPPVRSSLLVCSRRPWTAGQCFDCGAARALGCERLGRCWSTGARSVARSSWRYGRWLSEPRPTGTRRSLEGRLSLITGDATDATRITSGRTRGLGAGKGRGKANVSIASGQSPAARSSSSKISTQSRTQRSQMKSPGPATSLGRSALSGGPVGIVLPS